MVNPTPETIKRQKSAYNTARYYIPDEDFKELTPKELSVKYPYVSYSTIRLASKGYELETGESRKFKKPTTSFKYESDPTKWELQLPEEALDIHDEDVEEYDREAEYGIEEDYEETEEEYVEREEYNKETEEFESYNKWNRIVLKEYEKENYKRQPFTGKTDEVSINFTSSNAYFGFYELMNSDEYKNYSVDKLMDIESTKSYWTLDRIMNLHRDLCDYWDIDINYTPAIQKTAKIWVAFQVCFIDNEYNNYYCITSWSQGKEELHDLLDSISAKEGFYETYGITIKYVRPIFIGGRSDEKDIRNYETKLGCYLNYFV